MFTSRRITTLGGDKFRDESSLAFDGSDDYIDLGSQAGDLRLSGSNGAIVTWIKPVSGGDTYQRIVDKSDGATAQNGYSFILHTDAYIQGDVDGNSGVAHSNTALTYGVWSHCVWTWDGSNHYIYINGKLDDTASSSLTPPSDTTNMRIGSWNHSTAREFEGNISEVAIYNTGLTASQVKTIYNGREPYNHKEGIASSNLKGWWRMGDGRFDKNHAPDPEEGLIGNEVSIGLGSDLLGGKGDMSDASYWTLTGDASDKIVFADGVCKFTASDNGTDNMELTKASLLTVGKVYRVDVDVTAIEDPATILAIDNNPEYITFMSTGDTAVGRYTAIYRSTQTTFKLYRWKSGQDTEDYLYVDNLVIREVTGDSHGIVQSIPTFTGDTP